MGRRMRQRDRRPGFPALCSKKDFQRQEEKAFLSRIPEPPFLPGPGFLSVTRRQTLSRPACAGTLLRGVRQETGKSPIRMKRCGRHPQDKEMKKRGCRTFRVRQPSVKFAEAVVCLLQEGDGEGHHVSVIPIRHFDRIDDTQNNPRDNHHRKQDHANQYEA